MVDEHARAEESTGLPEGAGPLLAALAAAPEGLPDDWFWEAGRGGFSGPHGTAYRACAEAGLAFARGGRTFLAEAGVTRLGLAAYPAGDPSTWSEAAAGRFYLRGQCHALAAALSRSHGYRLVAMLSRGRPLHVFAEDADGTPYDFDGATSRERMLADCGVASARFVALPDEAALRRYVGGHGRLPEIGESDVAMALRYVAGRPDKFAPATGPSP